MPRGRKKSLGIYKTSTVKTHIRKYRKKYRIGPAPPRYRYFTDAFGRRSGGRELLPSKNKGGYFGYRKAIDKRIGEYDRTARHYGELGDLPDKPLIEFKRRPPYNAPTADKFNAGVMIRKDIQKYFGINTSMGRTPTGGGKTMQYAGGSILAVQNIPFMITWQSIPSVIYLGVIKGLAYFERHHIKYIPQRSGNLRRAFMDHIYKSMGMQRKSKYGGMLPLKIRTGTTGVPYAAIVRRFKEGEVQLKHHAGWQRSGAGPDKTKHWYNAMKGDKEAMFDFLGMVRLNLLKDIEKGLKDAIQQAHMEPIVFRALVEIHKKNI